MNALNWVVAGLWVDHLGVAINVRVRICIRVTGVSAHSARLRGLWHRVTDYSASATGSPAARAERRVGR